VDSLSLYKKPPTPSPIPGLANTSAPLPPIPFRPLFTCTTKPHILRTFPSAPPFPFPRLLPPSPVLSIPPRRPFRSVLPRSLFLLLPFFVFFFFFCGRFFFLFFQCVVVCVGWGGCVFGFFWVCDVLGSFFFFLRGLSFCEWCLVLGVQSILFNGDLKPLFFPPPANAPPDFPRIFFLLFFRSPPFSLSPFLSFFSAILLNACKRSLREARDTFSGEFSPDLRTSSLLWRTPEFLASLPRSPRNHSISPSFSSPFLQPYFPPSLLRIFSLYTETSFSLS